MWLVPLASLAQAQEIVVLEGVVPDDGLDHFLVPFEVADGVLEIEVRHDDLSEANILDWGLQDPNGHRGWGGGNTEPAVLNAQAASRSYHPGPIAAGTWSVVVGKAKIVESPAQYRIEVELRAQTTLPPQTERSPYAPIAPLEETSRWYAGDLHVHSLESGDASASLDAIADYARSRGLDFVVITDHNTVTHLDFLLDAQARHPDVLFIPGTEFTTYAGHANAFGVRAWVDHKVGQPGVSIESAAAAYQAQSALLSINHPALDLGDNCIGCAWDLPMPLDTLDAIEIGTGGWEPVGFLFTPDVIALWDSLCAEGHRLTAVGGSDDHRAGTDTGPFASPIGNPTTLVYAQSLSEQAILDGIASGRTVVQLRGPQDPMIELSIDGDRAHAEVSGVSSPGAELVWVVDGVYGERLPLDASEDDIEASIALGAEARAVRAEIDIAGAPVTVTSYLWRGEEGDTVQVGASGCGCGGMRPTSGAAILALAALMRRRGRHVESDHRIALDRSYLPRARDPRLLGADR